jgi:hypothetical protein
MTNLNIYQIEQEYISLAESIINNGGEVDEATEQALAINKDQLEQKGRGYGFVVKQLENDCDIIDSEIARLRALKDSRSKTIDKLKETVKNAMELYDITEIKTATLKINFRKSESVEIFDEALLTPEYLTTKTTTTPNKTAIKDAIKAGSEVQGATIKTNNNLTIK